MDSIQNEVEKMNDKDISMLLLENMGNFRNLIKIANTERYNIDKVLTEKQFFVLITLNDCKKIELKNLSKELHVSTSSLCILLNKLVEKQYVYREEDSRDRRNTFYGITERGESIINSEIEKFVSIASNKVNELSKDEKDILTESLINVSNMVGKIL